jgi:hypothetical protein
MALALEWARALDIGTTVAIECLGGDPRDPYGCATECSAAAAPDRKMAPALAG